MDLQCASYSTPTHRNCTGSSNPSQWKAKTYLSYIVSSMTADGLAMQGDIASAAMIHFARDSPSPTR